jgi:hypothetical protein
MESKFNVGDICDFSIKTGDQVKMIGRVRILSDPNFEDRGEPNYCARIESNGLMTGCFETELTLVQAAPTVPVQKQLRQR